MKISVNIILYLFLLAAIGCKKDEEPKEIKCGCESDAEAVITNISGKIEFDTSEQPISYRLQGYYATALAVCNDSTFQILLAQNKIMNGDSVVFGGEAKNTCRDCEFCGLIKINNISKK